MTSTVPKTRVGGQSTGASGGHGSGRFSRRLALAAAAAVAVVLLGGWIVAFSPLLGVHSIVVRGAHRLRTSTVVAAADIPSGTPLLRLDTAAAAHRVERLPEIASARVTTSFPRTVIITITERQPVGVERAGRSFQIVDRTGVAYRTVPARPQNLPLLVLPRGASAKATAHALAVVAADLPASVRARLRSIQALDPSSITLVLRSGRLVRWGSPARSDEKARLLPALLGRRSQEIDLTDPERPVTR